MKTILGIFLFLPTLIFSNDGPFISGDQFVYPGIQTEYNVTWEQWDQTYEMYANVTWSVSGGTVIESDKHSIKISWNESGKDYMDGIGRISVTEDLGGQETALDISVTNTDESPSEFCDGILGASAIAVDFGSGNNPGTPLPNGKTTYQYNSNCTLNVGEYTIVNKTVNCRSLWHNISKDHTGNTNGYFLMLNANDRKNEIYRTTVNNLIQGFRYEFSAWVGNLYNAAGAQKPNIKFEIYNSFNGTLIASSGIIDIPETIPNFKWQRIGFMFDIPAGINSVDIVLTNARRSTDNQGNDMVVDDIGFAPCLPAIIASFSSSASIGKSHACDIGTVNLFSSWPATIPFPTPKYQWQRSLDGGLSWNNIIGATSKNYFQNENIPGIYRYRIISYDASNPSQKVISNEIIFYVQKMVVDTNTTDFFSCNGANASGNLRGIFRLLYSDPADASSLIYTYAWTPKTFLGNSSDVNPAYIIIPSDPPPLPNGSPLPPKVYNYTFKVTNANYGCTASNTQVVKVNNPRKVGVANAFAPSRPAPNNVFVPINIEDYPQSEFSVYNRWGQRVFYSVGPSKLDYTWDGTYKGKKQPMEVYTWTILLKGCPENLVGGIYHGNGKWTGGVTLIR